MRTQRKRFTQLARWQALAFAGKRRATAAALWPAFYLDLLQRWASKAVWVSDSAVLVGVGSPLKAGRALALMAGAVLIVVGLAVVALTYGGAAIVVILVMMTALVWLMTAVVALRRTALAPAETKQARRQLGQLRRRTQGELIELASVARGPDGRRGAGLELMSQTAEELSAAGALVACIARSQWHQDYYCSSPGWIKEQGLLCRYVPPAPAPE